MSAEHRCIPGLDFGLQQFGVKTSWLEVQRYHVLAGKGLEGITVGYVGH